MGVHMLPYQRTFGDKKLCSTFFIVPTSDIKFTFGHESVKEFLYKDFVHLSSGRFLVMKG
jgi:hypothetical protein